MKEGILMKKTGLLTVLCMLVLSVVSFAETTVNTVKFPKGIKNITAVTEVFGTGQKLTGVIIEYNTAVKNDKLTKETFEVTD